MQGLTMGWFAVVIALLAAVIAFVAVGGVAVPAGVTVTFTWTAVDPRLKLSVTTKEKVRSVFAPTVGAVKVGFCAVVLESETGVPTVWAQV